MQFEIAGERDPFLLIKLNKGETVYSEAGAMVSMGAGLDLEGEIRGGLLGALGRKLVSGESLFTQKIVAARAAGEVLLAPSMPGDIQVLDVSPQSQYILNDGAFLAAETSVDLKMKVQGIGKSMFGGTGGFFVIQTAGYGKLAIGGFGSVFGLNVSPEEDIIIDNEHVVAWDARLNYDISVRTSKSQSLVGSLLNSVTSGEGFVNRFSGTGKVYVSSRNFAQLAGLLRAKFNTSETKSVL
ncbi:TIGR00266 family protein [Nostoc sp. CHAB 5834]|nr:TIGR00266 family protein [Nostoc sp. CHAB 5834]